uniref:Tissue factor pathway inhibitor n=1 Tax=Rhipicephalus zambeziensis TaxID=60191 RepID=A0A224YLB7_9ACAR
MLIKEFLAVLQLFCGLRYVSVIKKPVACYMKPDYGTCKRHLTRYFYNDSNYKCRTFDYSGCGGNGNNFDTRRECRYLCGGEYSSDDLDITRPVACYMEPEYGNCRKNYTRYFFNATEGLCSSFVYNGCGGNGNNFRNMGKCRNLCGEWYDPNKESCLDPPSNIWCPIWPIYAEMWYFDAGTEKCIAFLYHQCARDQNVFPTCKKCMQQCRRYMKRLQRCPRERSVSTPRLENDG